MELTVRDENWINVLLFTSIAGLLLNLMFHLRVWWCMTFQQQLVWKVFSLF